MPDGQRVSELEPSLNVIKHAVLERLGHVRLERVKGVAVHGADEQLSQPAIMFPNVSVTRLVTRSVSSAAAFSVNVNAMTLRGSTSVRRRISMMRCEMTWVLPDPAHATISSGSSMVAIAASWAAV